MDGASTAEIILCAIGCVTILVIVIVADWRDRHDDFGPGDMQK